MKLNKLKNFLYNSNFSKICKRNFCDIKTDEHIALSLKNNMVPINKLLKDKLNINEDHIHQFGKYKCKLSLSYIDTLKYKKDGKLILVSAMTPTKYGEGKTCTSVGLSDGLNKIGKNSIVSLREPSLGPVFGMKGGATGGGYSQLVPMDDINLHFTGDLHAITSAHNLLASAIDNHIYWGNKLNFDFKKINWTRVIDINDRTLRNIIIGIGDKNNGIVRQDKFEITVASEIMAIFCLSKNLTELNQRLGDIIIGFNINNIPITASQLNANGAMTALLRDAFSPNIVQTLEQNPAVIHGGPFANIAHGCSSIISTKTALKLADYTVTEAGFGSDLGAEKFFNIKCRQHNLKPDITVVVATIRAIKLHGNVSDTDLYVENLNAIEKGIENLYTHVNNIRKFNVPVVVALNKFHNDSENEIQLVKKLCKNKNINIELSEHHKYGGNGAINLAKLVCKIIDDNSNTNFKKLYPDNMNLSDKIKMITKNIYNAENTLFEKIAISKLKQIEKLGFKNLPVCIAKTQYSFTDNPNIKGAPNNHTITIKDVKLSAGAKFVVIYVGKIMTMPGLSKIPSLENISLDKNNNIIGLF